MATVLGGRAVPAADNLISDAKKYTHVVATVLGGRAVPAADNLISDAKRYTYVVAAVPGGSSRGCRLCSPERENY